MLVCRILAVCARTDAGHLLLIAGSPGDHGVENRSQAVAGRSQRVFHARGDLGIDRASEEPVGLHVAQLGGQHLLGHVADGLFEFAEAFKTALEQREAQRLLQEGLMSLPAEYRSILLLREVEGLTYSEISETLELELGTVKSRISRGRTLLRNFLSVSGNFFEKSASKVTECNREGMSAK